MRIVTCFGNSEKLMHCERRAPSAGLDLYGETTDRVAWADSFPDSLDNWVAC